MSLLTVLTFLWDVLANTDCFLNVNACSASFSRSARSATDGWTRLAFLVIVLLSFLDFVDVGVEVVSCFFNGANEIMWNYINIIR